MKTEPQITKMSKYTCLKYLSNNKIYGDYDQVTLKTLQNIIRKFNKLPLKLDKDVKIRRIHQQFSTKKVEEIADKQKITAQIGASTAKIPQNFNNNVKDKTFQSTDLKGINLVKKITEERTARVKAHKLKSFGERQSDREETLARIFG